MTKNIKFYRDKDENISLSIFNDNTNALDITKTFKEVVKKEYVQQVIWDGHVYA